MIETVKNLFENSNMPIVAALLLGFLTAISPCPLATNITATAYISKSLSGRKQTLISGLLYTLGLAFSYTTIALIIILGAGKFYVAKFFQSNGEKFVGPVMLVIGLIMLNIIRINFNSSNRFTEMLQERFKDKGLLGSFLLGALFAMAFCPYSGAMYFGVLIPMSIKSNIGWSLPIFYAMGAGTLVLFFTLILAFSIQKVGKYFKAVTKIEKTMRVVAGLLFILTGIYYILIYMKVI
jgi:cytochrome c biogenesis protein CcdA